MKISRRKTVAWMGMAGVAALGSSLGGVERVFAEEISDVAGNMDGETRWEQSARRKRAQTKDVVWLTHEPIEFLMLRGDHTDDEAEHYRKMLDPDNIRRMAAAGVKYGRIFFYKGFGLEFEKPHMEQAKRAADLMHQLGMKVSLYVGGTMFTETFYRETPEGVNWEQRDQWNQWIPYGDQTYRRYACPNEPAYRDYLRRVLKIAVEDLRADEIAFDNIMLQAEPRSCHCPRCIKAFSEFLRERYPTKEAAMRRFGLPDTDWLRVHEWESAEQPQSVQVLNDPVLQEWVRFRCVSLARYANDLYDSVKKLNPQVAVLFNIKGVYSFNRYWANAVYQPLYAGRIDLMAFDTGGYDEHIDATTGALISQIRSYKMARRLGTGCEDAFSNDVRAAVHMAFGYQKKGCVAAPLGSGAFNVFTPLMEFFREYNDRYYVGTENIADVAVLRNWPSMAYSVSAAYVPTTLMEQVLIQHKVPFDLLFEEQLERIGQYAGVILAGQECVSNAQAELLLSYVRNGGTLIVAGNTGQFNEWRERRSKNPLLPARSEGKGKIVYIAEIIPGDLPSKARNAIEFQDPEPGATAHRGVQMSPPQWVLPKNHDEIYKTIVSSLSSDLSLKTDAPLTTVMEVLYRAESKETIVHFVNFDRKNPTAGFAVDLRAHTTGATKSVMCLSPEHDEPIKLAFKEEAGRVTFTVPQVKTYSLIVAG